MEKAEKLAELLLKSSMSDQERAGWIEALPQMDTAQIDEFIEVLEKSQKEKDELFSQSKEKMAEALAKILS